MPSAPWQTQLVAAEHDPNPEIRTTFSIRQCASTEETCTELDFIDADSSESTFSVEVPVRRVLGSADCAETQCSISVVGDRSSIDPDASVLVPDPFTSARVELAFDAEGEPAGPPSVTVDRAAKLSTGDTVNVALTGYEPNSLVAVAQCEEGDFFFGLGAACGPSQRVEIGRDGSAETNLEVAYLFQPDGEGAAATCAGGCVIQAVALDDELGFNIIDTPIDVRLSIVPSIITEVSESDGTATIAVTLDSPTTVPVTATWFTFDHKETRAGEDYVASEGSIRFEPGQTSVPVTIELLDDGDSEGRETLPIAVKTPTGGARIGGFYGIGAAFILDDD